MKKCKVYKKCGSCSLLNLEYAQQLKQKESYCQELLKEARLTEYQVAKALGQKTPYRYRNKVIVAYSKDGRPGFYQKGTHQIIPYENCLLHDQETDEIIKKIGQMFKKYRIKIYNEDKKTGFLRHVLIRRGFKSQETMVVLVVSSFIFPGSKDFVKELTTAFKSIKTIVLNKNTRKTSVVLGQEEKVLFGKGFIKDYLLELEFRISPLSFYQINHEQCEVLYQKALDLLELTGEEVLLDTYCGIGTIGLIAASKVKEVRGIELNKDAVRDARKNAQLNNIKNVSFICADATKYMTQLAAEGEKVDIVVLDPTREGTTKEFIEAVKKLRPKKVLYISCDPRTQIRDLKFFKEAGFEGGIVYPVDLFPMTDHIETVVLLS